MASSSRLGEVKISLNSDSALGQPNFSIPNLDIVMKFMDKKYIRSCNTFEPQFSMAKLLDDLCRSYLKLGYRKGSNSKHANSQQYVNQGERNHFRFIRDITKGSEKVKISLIDETCSEDLPKFNYIPCNIIYQSTIVNISLARISDDQGCCSDCSGNCLSSPLPCPCAQETGGEFAYTPQGLLKEEFLIACVSMKNEPQDHHYVYCQECPLEKSKNEYMPERCKGHMVRKFIKECWRKCGNRIVQRGITCKLQLAFFTNRRVSANEELTWHSLIYLVPSLKMPLPTYYSSLGEGTTMLKMKTKKLRSLDVQVGVIWTFIR
ncbi:hypothetical protein JHK87_054530 [Glycine soja]|nr:hypothetical protein JHK87_054530 [Glycine soja]